MKILVHSRIHCFLWRNMVRMEEATDEEEEERARESP